MDLQLSMQSVPITTKVVSSNPAPGEVYSTQHYKIKSISDRSVVFFDINEIVLQVALNTITLLQDKLEVFLSYL